MRNIISYDKVIYRVIFFSMKNVIEKMKLIHEILLFISCLYENFMVSYYKIIFLKMTF